MKHKLTPLEKAAKRMKVSLETYIAMMELANRTAVIPEPKSTEDLCPFHDLYKDFAPCTCPPDHPNFQ